MLCKSLSLFFCSVAGQSVRKFMARTCAVVLVLFLATASHQAQSLDSPSSGSIAVQAKVANATELAKLAIKAHGGEKFKSMQTLIIRGSVDVTTSAVTQAFAASFITIFSGEKYRIEINNPFQPIKQIYDGVNTVSTIRGGLTLPPINRLGFPLLPHLGEVGYIATALPESKKKREGFRMTSPEGYFTDFYLDPKSKQIKAFDASYSIAGRVVTTSVEIERMRNIDGILLPEKYAQRFDTEQITIYAGFKAKEILVNTPIDDDVFYIEK